MPRPMSWSRRSTSRCECTRRGRKPSSCARWPRSRSACLLTLTICRRGLPETIADLAQHDLIGSDRALADREMTLRLLPGIDSSRFVIWIDSHPAQLAAARAGLGIAVVQRPLGLSDARLQPVLPELAIPNLDTWIVTHNDLRQLPRVRGVFDHLAEAFHAFAVDKHC